VSRYSGTFGRLLRLTDRMTAATDRVRGTSPSDRRVRARFNRQWSRASARRQGEIARLAQAGVPLPSVSRVLDQRDPYRRGVPENRPVRQRGRAAR
jgi:hypothetical protein